MLSGHQFVYFGDVWGGLMRNRHNLMQLFARENRVLFVERRPHLKPTLAGFRRGELSLAEVARPTVRRVAENLHVFRYPVWAPVSGRWPLRPLTRTIQSAHFQSALRRLGLDRPIVWFYHPEWLDLVDAIPSARLRLYHVVDEYTSYQRLTEADRRRIAERERRLIERMDAVFVVSPALRQAKQALHHHTYLVPNGVNYPAFAAALEDPSLPPDLSAIPRPRIGYSGLISDKLELETLRALAQAHPDWSLVFLGAANVISQRAVWEALLRESNVHYLGQAAWERVPHYLKGLDVGLMPYTQDRHSETISPLKMYDYLAAGLPIAAIDIPAVREMAAQVQIARDADELEQAVRQALADQSPERRRARQAEAARNSWEARAEELSGIIQQLLETEKPGRIREP